MNRIVFILACVICAVLAKCQHGDMDSKCKFKDQRDWSYMVFVESWPGAFCSDGCCSLPAGISINPTGFTMHGMWPNYDGKAFPSCCTSPYTRENILDAIHNNEQLKQELDIMWPTLKRCKFVLYETEKHGTCAATVYNGTNGFIDYWQAAMNVMRRYDIASALRRAGIVPSKTAFYSVEEIKAVIEPLVGAKVNLHCATGNKKHLSEVRICLKRPMNEEEKRNPIPFDCPRLETSCRNNHVELPPLENLQSGQCID